MLGKENTGEQVADNQSRLIRMQKEDTLLSSSQQILKLPEGFTIGKAIGGGDCFFDAVAQTLRQLKPNMEFTIRSLRQFCRELASSDQQLRKQVIQDARKLEGYGVILPQPGINDDELWKTYLIGIRYTVEDIGEMKGTNPYVYESLTDLKYGSALQIPILGRPEIEGKMICSEYNVKLHVIENLGYSGWSSYLIDELGSRSVSTNYSAKDTIHIINKGSCHFDPVLKKEVQQMLPLSGLTQAKIYEKFASVIEDCNLSENERIENLKAFFQACPKLDVNCQVNDRNDTPLHSAVYKGESKTVKFLLMARAHVSISNNEGKTPIDIAEENNRKDIVKILQPLVSYQEVDVPGDGSCLFWSVALAYLTPVKFDSDTFCERFKELFTSNYNPRVIQRLIQQGNVDLYKDNTLTTLVTRVFRGEIVKRMYLNREVLKNKISIEDFLESHIENYFTEGIFREEFKSKFGVKKIKKYDIDISKLQPKFFDKNAVKEICTELNKMKNCDQVQKFLFEIYLECMGMFRAWGGEHEISVVSELLETAVIVSKRGSKDYIYNEEKKHFNKIHLSYKGGNHYQFYQVKYSNLMKFVLSFVQSLEIKLIIYDVLASTLRDGNKMFFDGMDDNQFVQSILGLSAYTGIRIMSSERASLKVGNVIKATKSFVNLSDLIETFNEYKLGFRKILVDAGCNIFQSFEMQFEKIGFDHVSKIADDIVDKIIEYYIQREYKKDLRNIGIAETLVLNTYLQEMYAQYGGISYNIKDLYENIGIAEGSEGSFIYYRKKSEDKSSQYGYRRSLMGEKSKRAYDTGYNRIENTNVELENYVYTLDRQDFRNTVEQVFYFVNEEIQVPSTKRIDDFIVKIKSYIEQEVSFLSKYILFCCQKRKRNLDMNVKYLVKGEIEGFSKEQRIRRGKELIERTEKNRDVISLMEKNLKTIPNSFYHRKVKEAFVSRAEVISQDYSNLFQSNDTAEFGNLWSRIKVSSVKALELMFKKMDLKSMFCPVEEFIGRKEQIDEVYRRLQEGAVIIIGPSGIGKTQLARKFVEENKQVYLHAYEVNTQDMLSIESSFASLVRDKVAMSMEGEEGKGKKKCLILFRGAKKEDVKKVLKIRQERGGFDCLFTSSDQNYQDIAEVSLDNLGEKEAIQLVKRILEITEKSQDEQIEALVRKLKGFPLAIKLAAAYIKNKRIRDLGEAFGIFEYLIQYEKFDQKFPRNTKQNEYDRILQITLLISMKTIEEVRYGGEVLEILNTMAYLGHGEIDPSLFLAWIEDEDELYSIFELLEQHSIIYSEETDEYKVYIMHELIKKAIRSQFSVDEEKQILSCLIELVSGAVGDFYLEVGHLLSLFDHSKKYDYLIEENKNFPCLVLSSLNELHEYQKVINLTSESYKLLTVDDGYSRLIKYEFACTQASLGLYDRALKIFLDLKKLEKIKDAFPSLTLDKKILSTYLKQKNYKDVLSYVKYNNFIVKGLLDKENLQLIEEYLNIATIVAETFVMCKRYHDAFMTLHFIEQLRDIVFLKKKTTCFDSESYDNPCHNESNNLKIYYVCALANFFMIQDKRKLKITKALLPHKEDVMSSPEDIIKFLLFLEGVLKDTEKARCLCFKVYCMEVASELSLIESGKETLKQFKKVLKMQMDNGIHSKNNPEVLSVTFYIALLRSYLGDKMRALQELEILQDTQEKVIGLNHPSTLETVNAIQELFTEGEDKLTYLKNEIEKRESLLQSEKSDLNVHGVSFLKEIYAEKNSNDHASSSGELLSGNKRSSLGTENIQPKRRKIDNQQPVISYLHDVNVGPSHQRDTIINL